MKKTVRKFVPAVVDVGSSGILAAVGLLMGAQS